MTRAEHHRLAGELRAQRPRTGRALVEVATQLAWLGVGAWLSTTRLWLAGQLVLGLGFWRSFAMLHAAGHGSLFPGRLANDLAGHLLAPTCWIPYLPWKHVHAAHHRWTGWLDLDPTMSALAPGALPRWQAAVVDFCWRAWIPLVSVVFIATHFFSAPRRRWSERASIALFVLPHALALALWPMAWLRLFGVATVVYLELGDLSLLAQHVHLPMRRANGADVRPVPRHEQARYSRSMRLPRAFERWVALGFNRHAFHHLFPTVPYWVEAGEAHHGHVTDWRAWLGEAKSMRATELLFGAPPESACAP